MKRIIWRRGHPTLLTVLFLIFNNIFSVAQLPVSISLTRQQWKEDIDYLYTQLSVRHLNLYHYTSKPVFDASVKKLLTELDNLNELEIFLRIKQIVALAGDGHTFISNPSNYHLFPLYFFEFSDGLRVINADKAYSFLLGKKLKAINNVPLESIFDSLNTIIAGDESSTNKMKDRVSQICTPEHLSAFQFIKVIDSATFQFEDTSNTFNATIRSVAMNETINWVSAFTPDPLYLSDINSAKPHPLWWKELNDEVFYFSFQGYADWEIMKNTCDSMYSELCGLKGVKKIVIDLRLNGGGNFDKGLRIVLPTFMNLNAIRPGIKYFLLFGRSTFSAGMANAVHLRDCLNALTIGEPTGAKPNGYQELKKFELPHSRLTVGYATIYYTFQKENTNGVQPDIFIKPNFIDYQKGKDKAIEYILRYNINK